MRPAYSIALSENAQLSQLFHQCRLHGYQGIQLKPPQYRDFLQEPKRFLETYNAEGLVSGLIVSFPAEQGLAQLNETIRFLGEVGGDLLVLLPPGLNRAPSLSISELQTAIRDLASYSGDLGVRLSLHNHAKTIIETTHDIDMLFEGKAVNFGLTLDTAHLALGEKTDIPRFIRERTGIINNIHLKDLADRQFRALGEGNLDLGGVLGALAEIGYTDWLCVDEESGSLSLEESMARGNELLLSYFS